MTQLSKYFPHHILIATLLLVATDAVAAIDVPNGCAAPPASAPTRNFYIDPLHGAVGNDGSSAHPWHTLAEAISADKFHPQAGDAYYLLSGPHGAIALKGLHKSNFITIAAAPQAKPLVYGLTVTDSSKLLINGLTVENDGNVSGRALVHLGHDITPDGTSDIIFTNNIVRTAPDDVFAKWDDAERTSRIKHFAVSSNARCSTISHNVIRNVKNAIGIYAATDALILDNEISNFAYDGIDINGSRLTLRQNRIHDHLSLHDGQHPDCVQGIASATAPEAGDILIDGNLCLLQTDQAKAADRREIMQGISVFDGQWRNWTVINNIIITRSYHGISLFGVHHALVANNTVLSIDPRIPAWIRSYPMKKRQGGRPPEDNIIRNNISNAFPNMKGGPTGVSLDHNVVAVLPGNPYSMARLATMHPGLTFQADQELFIAFAPDKGMFDVHLSPTSAAIGAGTAERAPEHDFDGRARGAKIDAGAYAAH